MIQDIVGLAMEQYSSLHGVKKQQKTGKDLEQVTAAKEIQPHTHTCIVASFLEIKSIVELPSLPMMSLNY